MNQTNKVELSEIDRLYAMLTIWLQVYTRLATEDLNWKVTARERNGLYGQFLFENRTFWLHSKQFIIEPFSEVLSVNYRIGLQWREQLKAIAQTAIDQKPEE